MRLLIFGLTVSSSWGNGHATLWRGLWRALARRGHSIVFLQGDVTGVGSVASGAEVIAAGTGHS